MATTYNNDIQKLYVAYFNRPADPNGLAFWETAVEAAKGSTAGVAAEFAKQAEYTAAFSGKTNAQIVDQVYVNLFGRSSAGDTGAQFWIDGLNNKVITIADVVTSVAAGAQGSDKIAFANKVTAAASFTGALDTDAEKAGYVGDAANKIAKAFLAGITTDTTLAAATTPAALNATVASAVAAGTPFSIASAVTALNAAISAEKAFLVTADGDKLATTSATKTSLETNANVTTANKVAGDLTAVGATATFNAGSDAVKAALIADQVNANATTLATAQATLLAKNADVAKVAGLQAAIDALAAAKTVQTAAVKADTAATADLVSKEAAFEVNNSVTVTFAADGTAKYTSATVTTAADLIVKDADTGALKLANSTAVTEAKMPGVTALLASSVALEAADAAVTKANTAVSAATLTVHYTDVTTAETTALQAVATKFAAVDPTVKLAGDLPTEAEMATELAALKAKSDADPSNTTASTNYTDFKGLVDAYHTAALVDPNVSAQKTAADAVTTATDAIKTFTADVAAYNAAKGTLATFGGYDANVLAAQKVFADNGYIVSDLGTTTTLQIASASSDLFLAGSGDVSIALFGLQGKDALFIGSDYTLNTTKDMTGVDTVKEVFIVGANGGADTQIVLEKTAFGSSATVPEVVTITLTGVSAADVHLNNGIITVGGPTA
jgi:hypothetical protein